MNIHDFRVRGLETRRARAEERRAQVKVLRDQGLSGPEIAAELGVKPRTVYQDFAILNQAEKEQQTEKADTE